jgi:glutaredoxin 3
MISSSSANNSGSPVKPTTVTEIKTHRVLPPTAVANNKWSASPHSVVSKSSAKSKGPSKPSESTNSAKIPASQLQKEPSRKWRKQMQDQLEDMESGQMTYAEQQGGEKDDQDSTGTGKTDDAPTETKVIDVMEHCPAQSLEESVDMLIRTSKVVVFEKSWCLFSIDSKDFLLNQLGVSFISIPVDEAKDGDAIVKYIQQETGHKTFPAIFVKGDFLGGFEDVNAMYSTGQLEEEYFQRVSQADRCEMEARAIKSGKKPLFWFPKMVNAYSVRFTGVITCLASLASCVGFRTVWGPMIAGGILFDFALRIIAGPRLSVMSKIGCFLSKAFEPKMRLGRPKQFAGTCLLSLCGMVRHSAALCRTNVVQHLKI